MSVQTLTLELSTLFARPEVAPPNGPNVSVG